MSPGSAGRSAGRQHPAGGVLVVEGIAGMALDQLHEGQRGRPSGSDRKAEIDLRGGQFGAQHVAEQIVRQPREEPRRRPEPAERDRGVEHRAAGIGGKGRLARGRLPRQHVDQRLAATQDHPGLPVPVGPPLAPRRPPGNADARPSWGTDRASHDAASRTGEAIRRDERRWRAGSPSDPCHPPPVRGGEAAAAPSGPRPTGSARRSTPRPPRRSARPPPPPRSSSPTRAARPAPGRCGR